MKFQVLLAVLLISTIYVHAETEKEMRASVLDEVRREHPIRESTRKVDPLSHELADRASLFFRALDADHDKFISVADVQANAHKLSQHVPGVDANEFSSFLQMADHNNDQKLSREEFLEALAKGMESVSLLETSANTDANARRTGFLGDMVRNGMNAIGKAFRGITGKVDASNDGCVICQYIVERAETNVKQSGVIPALTGAQTGPTVFLEEESTALLQVEESQSPFDMAAANIIGSTRLSTRYQRQLERQKYNEIYRVVDITLDDVCEQGMPTSFYSFCKAIYQAQSDVVDGLRYQYRPADVCFRVGMCGKDSYITKGVHSRYVQK